MVAEQMGKVFRDRQLCDFSYRTVVVAAKIEREARRYGYITRDRWRVQEKYSLRIASQAKMSVGVDSWGVPRRLRAVGGQECGNADGRSTRWLTRQKQKGALGAGWPTVKYMYGKRRLGLAERALVCACERAQPATHAHPVTNGAGP